MGNAKRFLVVGRDADEMPGRMPRPRRSRRASFDHATGRCSIHTRYDFENRLLTTTSPDASGLAASDS
ncbi:MAG: hypothetical protein WA432_05340, partial [Candidatus Babeliaceae bacterium]